MLSVRYLMIVVIYWCYADRHCTCTDDDIRTININDDLDQSHGKVVYSSVIFRHGDRTIKARYPSDPYPESIWGGRLQLTKIGKQQVYDLGKWYQKRYAKLFPRPGYNYSLILMNSTNTDRALMSAELFLAGMFPPTVKELWADDGLLWQPIPVHADQKERNNVLGDVPCARYDQERDYWSSSTEVQIFYQHYEDSIRYICKQANYTTCSKDDVFSTIQNVWTVYNALYIEELNGLTLPEWTYKIYPEPSRTISAFYFLSKTYSLEMRRLKGGPLLKNIVNEMEEKRAGTLKRILHFYSGQETTIAIFLHTLDLYNFMIPNYTASIMVELREKENQFYVTLLYRNATDQPPCLLQIPGCEIYCTLDQFKQVTKYLMVENWHNECNVGFFEQLYLKSIVYTGLIILVFVAAIIIIFVIRVSKEKNYSKFDYRYI